MEVQYYIYQIAKKEIEKGNNVAVEFHKIIVNGKALAWDELEGDRNAKKCWDS